MRVPVCVLIYALPALAKEAIASHQSSSPPCGLEPTLCNTLLLLGLGALTLHLPLSSSIVSFPQLTSISLILKEVLPLRLTFLFELLHSFLPFLNCQTFSHIFPSHSLVDSQCGMISIPTTRLPPESLPC